MRPLATSVALAGLALAVSCAAACSSTPESSPAPTETTTNPTSTTDAVQGPLSGTYSADTTDGAAPFITITFFDQSHYQYVATSCVAVDLSQPGDDGDDDDGGVTSQPDLGDDPGDQVADNGATADYDADPTDDGCIHSGTYSFTASTLTLTDDGATTGVTVPIGQIAADGTEVTDPSATVLTGESQTLEGAPRPDTLVVGLSSALFGSTSVSQFSAAGTSLRRTGLSTGSGVGTACTVSTTGASGTCMTTASCAAAGKSSTPDYCPGPANVQCCTTGSGSTGSSGGSGTNTMNGLVTAAAVATAETWVSVKMPYCQAANGGHELDSSCFNVTGRTCTRTGAGNQAKWNKYRSDCSGLVSYSWGLPAPGLTTSGFLPGTAKYIPMEDLQPGDALIRPGHHMVLFKAWKSKSAGTATVVSEPGCSAKGGPYAQDQSWSMGKAPGAATSAHWAGATYYSIRKKTAVLAQ